MAATVAWTSEAANADGPGRRLTDARKKYSIPPFGLLPLLSLFPPTSIPTTTQYTSLLQNSEQIRSNYFQYRREILSAMPVVEH